MQRLYSMFPAGGPGIGLLLLRLGIAAALFLGVPSSAEALPAKAHAAMLIALGIALCVGVVTPVLAILCCALAIICIAHAGVGSTAAILVLLDGAALGLLGPGAYSLDARLFGRRVLVLSEKHPRDE